MEVGEEKERREREIETGERDRERETAQAGRSARDQLHFPGIHPRVFHSVFVSLNPCHLWGEILGVRVPGNPYRLRSGSPAHSGIATLRPAAAPVSGAGSVSLWTPAAAGLIHCGLERQALTLAPA